jgi:DNA-binding transcriptional regulator YhcF (GntR family)
MINKKRRIFPQGIDCYKAKLTENQVKEIRSTRLSISDMKKLAYKFNVHYNTIREVYNGKTWRHLAQSL